MNTREDIDIIIARYLAGDATPEETARLLEWIELSDDNRRDFFRQHDLWNALFPAIDPAFIDTARAESRVLERTGTGGRRRFLRRLMRVAAVLLIILVPAALYFALRAPADAAPALYKISTAYGYTMQTTLPDGSEVWLNANSTLSYPARFDSGTRAVGLEGEAYFKVSADREHPFVVHTTKLSVSATGTQFNVNDYTRSPFASVTLVDGIVDVNTPGADSSMRPGQHLCLHDGKVTLTADADLDRYCAWRDGVLIFNDDRLSAICDRLEQIHNVEFEIDSTLARTSFHIILNGENISEIMHMLQLCAPIDCVFDAPDSNTPSACRHITIVPRT